MPVWYVCCDSVMRFQSMAHNELSTWWDAMVRWMKYWSIVPTKTKEGCPLTERHWKMTCSGYLGRSEHRELLSLWRRVKTTQKHFHLLLLRKTPLASWITLSPRWWSEVTRITQSAVFLVPLKHQSTCMMLIHLLSRAPRRGCLCHHSIICDS